MQQPHHTAVPAEYLLDCYWQLDLDLRIEYASPAAEGMFGIPADALVGSPLEDHTDPADFGRLRDRLALALGSGDRSRSFIYRTRIVHADGRRIPVEVHSRLLLDHDGEPRSVVGLARDVSARERHNARTRRQEQQRAQQQHQQALGNLAGDLARLLEPLIAALDQDDADQGMLANQAREQQQLLQILSGRLELHPQELTLDQWLPRLFDDIRVTLPEGLALLHQPGVGGAMVRADEQLLATAVTHLCRAAAHGMSAGGVIRVATESHETPSDPDAPPSAPPPARLRIAISDTGPGLTREQRDHLLEPRLGPDQPLPHVALAHGIIVAHQGQLHIESQPDQGTTVTLVLPASHASASQPGGGELKARRRILLVDDDPEIRRYVAKVLRSSGFQAVSCEDGVEALALLSADDDPFDAVVLDWALPGLDGRRVREQLQARHPNMPLLVISGHQRQQYEALGGVDADTPWLMKPFTPTALLRSLQELLDQADEAHGS